MNCVHIVTVLNVQSCMRQVDGPQQITKEAVLLTVSCFTGCFTSYIIYVAY